MKKLITSALPYVNNVPHLGNIIGCVLSADVYARFCRLKGYETLYICGTDEYGTATENRAREEGLTPKQICDKYHAIHKAVYADFDISFDYFGRTSTPDQTEVAQSIFKDLDHNGLISEHTEQRTFCTHDDMFLADRYVQGTCPHCSYEDARGDQCDSCGKLLDPETLVAPKCQICGNRPQLKETTHLHLDLGVLQPRLEDWFKASAKKGAWTRNAVQTTQSWMEKGLASRPITRDLKWGIPVPKPGFENKVFYVWFDAPIGYISITKEGFPKTWQHWWLNPEKVELYQFMAKDNIPFHTVIFPASQLGSGRDWTMLHHISSTEYLNYENTKFSKSRGIGVFGHDVPKTGIPIDLWRFYLLATRPERNDSFFNWDEFFEKVNSEFLDNIGNLVNRTLVFLKKNFDGVLAGPLLPEAQTHFLVTCRDDCRAIDQALEDVKLREALRLILALGNKSNKFFQDMQPWESIKTNPEDAHATVTALAYVVRALGVFLQPYMPDTGKRILAMLKLAAQTFDQGASLDGLSGHQIGNPQILFPKLDMQDAARFRKKFSGNQPNFGQFDIRAGRIVEVKPHPAADHAYLLQVDLGELGRRQIVGALVKHYTADQLQDRNVLVLSNLETADIRGERSEGMLLAAEKRKKMELLQPGDAQPGTRAAVAEQAVKPGNIAIDTFKAAPFEIAENRLRFDEQVVQIQNQPICTEQVANGKVR